MQVLSLKKKNQPSAHLHNPRKLLQSSKEWLERRRNRTHRKGLRCPNSVIIPKPLIYFPFQNVIRFTGEKKEKHHFLKCLKLKRNKKQNLHSKCTWNPSTTCWLNPDLPSQYTSPILCAFKSAKKTIYPPPSPFEDYGKSTTDVLKEDNLLLLKYIAHFVFPDQ